MRINPRWKTSWPWRFVLLSVIGIGSFSAVKGDTPEPVAADQSQRTSHVVAVRISDVLLTGLFNRTVDVQMPVRDVILGTPIIGTARVAAKSHVVLVPSAVAARFAAVFQGTG